MSRREIECSARGTMVGSTIARNYSTKSGESVSKLLISRQLGRHLSPCYHRPMRQLIAVMALAAAVGVAPRPVWAADPLNEARRLYNLGDYDAAERAARDALRVTATADAARVVL